MNRPLISIIVPVYQAEERLCRCLDSILAQTVEGWECILVDDGSRDRSGALCDEYARKDGRFKVIHKENGGASSARNAGLEKAEGGWVAFVDADDAIGNDYLDILISSETDLVVCGFTSAEGWIYSPSPSVMNRAAMTSGMEKILNSHSMFVPWAKLFRKNILDAHQLRFDEKLRLSEDTTFVYEYLCHCDSLEFVEAHPYHYDGVWGGKGKYLLEWEEIEYLYDIRNRRIRQILATFSCALPQERYIYPALEHVRNLCKEHTDRECYRLYSRHHPDITEEAYFKSGLFIWNSLFDDVKRHYLLNDGDEYLNDLRHFITVPLPWIRTTPLKNAIRAFLIYYRLFLPLRIYGRFLQRQREARNPLGAGDKCSCRTEAQ